MAWGLKIRVKRKNRALVGPGLFVFPHSSLLARLRGKKVAGKELDEESSPSGSGVFRHCKIIEEILTQLVKMLYLLQSQSKVTGEKKEGGVLKKNIHEKSEKNLKITVLSEYPL